MDNIKEEFRVKGEELVEKVKQLIHEGNVRRLIIKDETGKVYLEIPVTVGVIGALIAPMLAAVGAIAAMVANLKIEVIRNEKPEKKDPPAVRLHFHTAATVAAERYDDMLRRPIRSSLHLMQLV
jgi:hypothetical protein